MKKRLIAVASVLFWLLVWQIAAMALDQKILLASPISVAGRLVELVPQFDFIKSILFSLTRIIGGFLLGTMTGVILSALAGKFSPVRQLLAPLISAVKAIPVASFTILALIWISSENLSVLISFLIAVPIVYSNMLEGIDSLDPKLTTMAEVFEIPAAKRFVGIYLSQLLPYFRSAAKLSMGLCWKSGVAAEVIGIPDGSIGEKLYMSKVYLETEDLFAWTLIIILLSYISEKIFGLIIDLTVKRVEKM